MANIITKNIPNTITCCNLISGCIATNYALAGSLKLAFLWIVIGAVFDFFDGMSARLLGVSSPIGKELDSLADSITFGFAPSAMLFFALSVIPYPAILTPLQGILPYFAFIMAAFSALRLAKFNLDERQSLGFIGLPTPANALFWCSVLTGIMPLYASTRWLIIALLVGICVSCWLLMAEISMFAFKFKQWKWAGNEVKFTFVLACIPILLLFKLASFAIIIALYVLISIYFNNTKRQ